MAEICETKSFSLMRNTNNIRNICIMAHVDHGKTTLADSLIASNGIISARLAGKLKYMDSRKDEQERGITMKSSSISLYHKKDQEYLINLIDSPGHVDFSLEVSTAVRLCDGTLIVVDVVEGVCPQTRAVLKHAWAEKIKPLLVLNKLDRLIVEMEMSPLDAYIQLSQVLEQVNSVMGELFCTDVMEKQETIERDTELDVFSDWGSGLEEADDSNLYFSPEQGNVIFASAVDGWGFTIHNFAEILAKKLGFNKNVLLKTLWGNYYLNTKTKRVMRGAQENAKKPLFVQLILENIWRFYETIVTHKDKEKTISMAESLNIDVTRLRFGDANTVLRTVFGRWMPLSSTILDSICEKLPPPNNLSDEKIDNLMYSSRYSTPCAETLALKPWFQKCSTQPEAPIIAFVSKMFPIKRKHLPENRVKPLSLAEIEARREQARQKLAAKVIEEAAAQKSPTTNSLIQESAAEAVPTENPDDDVFIAFARIYSGTICRGSEIYVLGPKHDPQIALQKIRAGQLDISGKTLKDLKADEHITKVTVEHLYLLMGRELEPLDEVPAGNVFGIGGLDEYVLKSATLSTTVTCPAFSELHLMATPILRVAIEPENPAHMAQLTNGLKLLNQADASVRVLVQESGEQVLVTTGEVHLQRCIEDLRERYAKVPILVSEPIVPFRETVVPPPKTDMVNEAIQHRVVETEATVTTANGLCEIRISTIPLPEAVVQLLDKHTDLVKFLMASSGTEITDGACEGSKFGNLNAESVKNVAQFRQKLADALKNDTQTANIEVDAIWSFGPKANPLNLLINAVDDEHARLSFWHHTKDSCSTYSKYESNFVSGFQLAASSGPLCEEPMMGVGFVVSHWHIEETSQPSGTATTYGPLSGQLMFAVKEGCRKAFQLQPQRLMAAMYSCNILVNTEVLGRMYGLLNKRHGRIVHGDLAAAGSGATFSVTAFLPVAESFAFASEVRKQSHGLANPQLVFSHWELVDMDPFWTPNTEEEYLLYGEKADSENYARKYMNNVRKRKGLPTDEKVVEHGEKQRTLSKNK
ncbi:hypothetical protein V9T40_004303 [Parthenolecanium corni]|uniref:Ribosome assembly protein 1 n=1 Tax=Parthenolecanium corni TaxID=536013 RepID=A0AAN9TWD6_9HEMI